MSPVCLIAQQLSRFLSAARVSAKITLIPRAFVCLLIGASASVNAETIYAVNCGGSAVTASNGEVYVADNYYTGGSVGSYSGSVHGASNPALHTGHRRASTPFGYAFPVANGEYVVDLLFIDDLAVGARQFDVSLEGNWRLDDYDIRANVPDQTEAVESLVVTVTDGVLNLSVANGAAGEGILSAIRIRTIAGDGPVLPELPFDNLVLIDEINCGDPNAPHEFEEFPLGNSQIQTILGVPTRVLPNPVGSDASYFAYRIGANKGLEAGKAYVLQVEYPEDIERTMYILNAGASMSRGLHTGKTTGDALLAPYVNNNPESLNIPLTGEFETWQNLFHLHDRFTGVIRNRTEGAYPDEPADGFWVTVAQFANEEAPLSEGAAVSRIRLYEAPAEEVYTAELNLPSVELPRRHIFYREEMADGIVWSYDANQRGLINTTDWFENKAKRMKFLGMNTYTFGLLEFGSNQGFDSGPGGGNDWYYLARDPERWSDVLNMLGNYDFDVLPYYEYSGSRGNGPEGIGEQRWAQPLAEGLNTYTTVSWSEISRADITDPRTIDDAKLLLDATISRYKDRVNFIGAWFRARISQMPISFNDDNLATFATEANGGIPVTRQQLEGSNALYENYKQWWFLKRRDFINALRDHLRAQGVNEQATILYTSDAKETGKAIVPTGQEDLVAEDLAAWNAVSVDATSFQVAMESERHRQGLLTPRETWSYWEYHHADMENDPANYMDNEGGMLTYTFNRAYTVSDPLLMDEFQTPSGMAAIRHFSLNEDAMTLDLGGPNQHELLGYFVSDCEYTGPFVMMEEALAYANGDIRYLGYLAAWRYNPGFPQYVRAFNQAFLSLPALPSTVLEGASSDPNVIVRAIETEGYGTYLGVVNVGRQDTSVTITLPEAGLLVDAVTNEVIQSHTDVLTLDMYPSQLRAFRLDPQSLSGAVAYDDSVILNEGTSVTVDVLSNDTGPGSLSLVSIGEARNGTLSIVDNQIVYQPNDGFIGDDSVSYLVSNGTGSDVARLYFTVTSTATAENVAAWGLLESDIGNFVESRSRLLANGSTAELYGSGRGFVGLADSAQYEAESVLGDFTLTARVVDSTQISDGAVGIMIRQGPVADSRFVAIGLDDQSRVTYYSRSSQGDAATEGIDLGEHSGWIRLTRSGELIELANSEDNVEYTVIGQRVLPGLPMKLQAGIFLYGGDVDSPVRGLVEDYSITNQSLGSNVLMAQGFSDGPDLSNYAAASPGQNQFSEIVAESLGGTWSIQNGELKMVRTGDSSSESGAGFARLDDFSGPPSVLKFSFDLGISGSSTNGTMLSVVFGDFSSVSDYNSGGASVSKFAQFTIKGNGVGTYNFPFGSQKYGESLTNGDMNTIEVYINHSGQTESYIGSNGEMHQIEDQKASYWQNGAVVFENFEAPASYSASGIKTFSVKVTSEDQATIRFDNFIAESTLPAMPTFPVNAAPIAVDDTASTNEGTSVEIQALANDTDPDNGPEGLRVTQVNPSANGMVHQSGNAIIYTPLNGFFGADSIQYTISDGVSTDTATIHIDVADTSVASNLNGYGLSGSAIGTSAGYSRELPNNEIELNATGDGLGGASDAIFFESLNYTGNFVLQLRMVDLVGLGVSPRGGIMIRESLSADSRMVALSTALDSLYHYQKRETTGGASLDTVSSLAAVYPAAWLRLERFEDTIAIRVSSDGVNYTDLDEVVISGLAETVSIGAFSAQARMIAREWMVLPWQDALFQQDFEMSNQVEDYFDGIAPGRNEFTDIGAEADAGAWSIENGALKLVRSGISSNENGAGFYQLVDFDTSPQILKVSFDLALENTSTYLDMIALQLGDWSTISDYNSTGSSSSLSNSLIFKSGGAGNFRFKLNGTNSAMLSANGDFVQTIWYVNNSGSSISYLGEDGVLHTLDHGSSSVWADGVLLLDNILRNGAYQVDDIVNFRLLTSTSIPVVMQLDNLIIEEDLVVNQPPNDGLDTLGFTALSIGANSSGDSSVISANDWQVVGTGNGFSGASDSTYFEQVTVSGDFSLMVRLNDLQSSAAQPRAGLMIRESSAAGARMVALSTTVTNQYAFSARSVEDGNVTESISIDTFSYPDAWLLLERVGNIVNAAISTDGVSFVQIESESFSELSESLFVGLHVNSGNSTGTASASFSDYALLSSSVVYLQNFEGSTNLGHYFDASQPNINQMNDISTEVDGGNWTISNGTLQLQRAGLSGNDAGAGFIRYTDFPQSSDLLKVEFDLSVNQVNTYVSLAHFRIGQLTGLNDYSGSLASVSTSYQLSIKGGGTGNFRFRIDGTNTSTFAADGSAVHVAWYMNTSGVTETYLGPDGFSYQLNDQRTALWVDSVLQLDNIPRNSAYQSLSLSDLYFHCPTEQAITIGLDNLTITNTL